MLATLRRVMSFEMTIAEWIGTAVILAVPYLVVGMAWTALHADQLQPRGVARVTSILGSIACWPALVFSSVCAT
jgi:apolipoprotein N-acyltransferase